MNYLNEVINLENRLLILLKEEKFDEFTESLKEREIFYSNYAKENPNEMKNFLNSNEFKNISKKINEEYERKKGKILSEMRDLVLTQKATYGYKSNVSKINNFFTKRI